MKRALFVLSHLKHIRIHHISLALCNLSIILLAAGLFVWLKPTYPRNLVRAEGTVIRHNSRVVSRSSNIMYYAVIEYQPPKGDKVTFNGEPANQPLHKVGDKVRIGYLEANPRYARDLSVRPPGFTPLALMTAALVAFAAAIVMAWHRHLHKRRMARHAAWEADKVPEDGAHTAETAA